MRVALAVCLLPGVALAELPPLYQRQAEILAIVQSEAVAAALNNDPIDMVRITGPDAYVVRSAGCKANVAIVGKALPDGMVGARQFDVVVQRASC